MKSCIAVIIFLISFSALAEDKVQNKSVLISSKNTELLDAINYAQATLDEFIKIYSNPPKGVSGFKLKVKITDSHSSEHMWITPFRKVGTGFVGTLADYPEYITRVKFGQNISFQKSDVSDWGIFKKVSKKAVLQYVSHSNICL